MLKFKKSEITKIVNKFTKNSELFCDEVASVTSQLIALSNSANEFGCAMTDTISDCWGGSVIVTALPDKRRHTWSF